MEYKRIEVHKEEEQRIGQSCSFLAKPIGQIVYKAV
jgi:hypothetical protein